MFYAFYKNSYILDPQILLWKTPYHMLFSVFFTNQQIVFMFLVKTKLL